MAEMQGRMMDELFGDGDSVVEVIEKLATSQGPNDPFTGAAYFCKGYS